MKWIRGAWVFTALSSVCLLVLSAGPAGHDGELAPFPEFADVTASAKVHFRTGTSATSQKYLVETMGGGVAVLDYDGDGRLDLFFVNGASLRDPMPAGALPDKSAPRFWNRLYHNNGDGTFTDVTERAGLRGKGYGMGVAVGDYDNDGRPDLYVTGWGSNALYRNNGDGTFTDVTARSGVAGSGWSVSAAWLDYDRDGYLDLFVTRYLDWDFSMNVWCGDQPNRMRAFCHPGVFRPVSSLLYRNNHDGTFTDVSARVGLDSRPGNGLGVAVNDFDRDGWPDIVVANDARPQQLFHNLGGKRFEELGPAGGIAWDDNGQSFSGMGVDFRDYDNDGWPDVFITDLATQMWSLFRNLKGQFEYASRPTGIGRISQMHSGWSAWFGDLDNDGWKDLFVAQSHVMDNIERTQPGLRYLEPPVVLRNRQGRFTALAPVAGSALAVPLAGRGAAIGDLDNDGFLDVVITGLDAEARILRNLGRNLENRNHWIAIDTIGTVSNRDGQGAQLHIVSESGREQWEVVSTAGGYLSARDKRVHFGLGPDRLVRTLEITWPSGIVQRVSALAADRIVKVREPQRNGAGNRD